MASLLVRRWPWIAGAALVGVTAVVVAASVPPLLCGTSVAAIGCANRGLAPPPGGSLVLAVGQLTGRTATFELTPAHEFELNHVIVLAGAQQPGRVRAWLWTVPDPSDSLASAQVPGMWAPDGRVLAYVPKNAEKASEPIDILPVVRESVVFSAAACNSAPESLPTQPFVGALEEVPNSYSIHTANCNGGFQQAPLSTVRTLITRTPSAN